MALTIIITICSLLLVAYLFDLTSSWTKVPSVILLLALGWSVKQVGSFFDLHLPDFTYVMPILGTIGLIMIVLEGSLELDLNKSKIQLIKKTFLGALIPMIALSFLLAYLFHYFGGFSLKDSLISAIPLSIISSSVAIPSTNNIAPIGKEFVIYESSLSDIFGVLFFNFIVFNEIFDIYSFSYFGFQFIVLLLVSFVATLGLSLLLSKIEHQIKFVPIILLVILIYAVSKTYHLPALIFILLFGLFIRNIDEFKRFKWTEKFRPDGFHEEVKKFKDLTIEGTFLIRALFFLLFGYSIETSEILNAETVIWAIGIVIIIFSFRAIQLKLSNIPLAPLLFIAPRGLITILLFLSIPKEQNILFVNNSLIIQVVILTALVMMVGLMTSKADDKEITSPEKLNIE